MGQASGLHCREEMPFAFRLTAVVLVLLLILPYHPLTWIAGAWASESIVFCDMSDGPCTCPDHQHAPQTPENTAPAVSTEGELPPCHQDDADSNSYDPPSTHFCGCESGEQDFTSGVLVDRFVISSTAHNIAAPEVHTEWTFVLTWQPLQLVRDIFRPPPR